MSELTDPTDFAAPSVSATIPTTVSQPLSTIDALLRCRVCKDFFTTPMITSCSHTFCSLCIRRCLSAEGKCPVCRNSEQEMRLRRNWAVEEMVEGWRAGRQGVLEGLNSLAVKSQPPSAEVHEERHKKKRKLDRDADKVGEIFSGRTTRARTRRAIGSSQEEIVQSPSQPINVISDSEGGSDYSDEEAQQPTNTFVGKQSSPQQPNDGLVPCPGCGKRMKEETVFSHLDRCASLGGPGDEPPERPKSRTPFGTKTSTTTNNSSLKPPTESPLPTINYSLLNDKTLRKKLKDLGIPDWGPKPLLQKRHTEWVNLWNANCDSRHSRTKRELLHELEVWERTQGGNAPSNNGNTFSNGTASISTGAGVGGKDFDKDEWSKSHQDDFKDLIRKAREKRAAATAATASENKSEEQQTATATATPLPDRAPAVSSAEQMNGPVNGVSETQSPTPDGINGYSTTHEEAHIPDLTAATKRFEYEQSSQGHGQELDDVIA